MRTIKQKGEYDCGVACVAMLAGVSYEEARETIFSDKEVGKTKTKQLHAALKELGRRPAEPPRRRFATKKPSDLETDALVFVELDNDGDKYKHWMVWDAKAKKLRDPYHTELPHRPLGYLSVD